MTAEWIRFSAAVVTAGMFGFATPAGAGTQPLVGTDALGNPVDSGWVASWADAFDDAGWEVNLTFRGLVGNQFFFEKEATFKPPAGNGVDGLEILFEKVDPNAKDLVIDTEIIRNQTGIDWIGFQWLLASARTGGTTTTPGIPSFAFTTSDGSGGIGDFNISPFTTFTFADNDSILNFSDGVLPNGATWFAGANSSTGIAIVANNQTTSSFVLKEVPIPIPLPAAAWTGMGTLFGLGLVAARNARKG